MNKKHIGIISIVISLLMLIAAIHRNIKLNQYSESAGLGALPDMYLMIGFYGISIIFFIIGITFLAIFFVLRK